MLIDPLLLVMDLVSALLLQVLALLAFSGLSGFAFVSWLEKEKRAAALSFGLAFLLGVCFLLLSFLPHAVRVVILVAVFLVVCLFLASLFLPSRRAQPSGGSPRSRFDERDIVFARHRLQPGSDRHAAYYSLHPALQAADSRARSRPGLLSAGSLHANPFQFAAASAGFFLTESLRQAVTGEPQGVPASLPPQALTSWVKALSRYYGALDVGIAALQPWHYYSHVGRGLGDYGDPIPVQHSFAIAFTVEMDRRMVTAGPRGPAVMESARQYVEAARIAVQLAAALRQLGFSARAHIDGNYQVIAPLVARDAGLGEIGRMTILLTPRLGPRVRLGVVTTSAPLVPDAYRPDPSVIDFCSLCRKCALNCPSQALPLGDRQEVDGTLRWRMDAEKCFLYWNTVGTDCARCMAVCPYAHPDNAFHGLVRWVIRRSPNFRRLALSLDDLFYGRTPPPGPGPDWTAGI